jgi:hypothetical protein
VIIPVYVPPTFNGDAIFGDAVIMTNDDPPNAAQVNHYPGTIGSERLDLGPETSYTMTTGLVYGPANTDVGAAFAVFRALKENAVIGTLVDTEGTTWVNCYIESFRGKGRLSFAPGSGWCREYEMKIGHLGTDVGGDDDGDDDEEDGPDETGGEE